MGHEALRLWRRIDETTTEADVRNAKGAECSWSVAIRDGLPLVFADGRKRLVLPSGFAPTDGPERPSAFVEGRAGMLIGFNQGEWGGSLRWYSEHAAFKEQLLGTNVVAVLPAFDHFVVLTSPFGGKGSAVEVRDENGQFQVGRTLELRSAPRAGVVRDDGSLLILTTKGLLQLTRDFRLAPLLEADWWALHPFSLTLAGNRKVYIGMRGTIAEVELSATPPTETYFYPP